MTDITCIEGIVKILETPKQLLLDNNIVFVKFRAQLASVRKPQIVIIQCWGNLAKNVVSSYKINQYLLIEGYPSFRTYTTEKQAIKMTKITGLRVYPFFLKTDNLNKKD